MIGRAVATGVLAALFTAGAPATGGAADCPAGADLAHQTRCAVLDWQIAQRRMYRRYRHARRAVARINDGTAYSLRVEQATWVLFRDSACADQAAAFGDQPRARLEFLICRTRMTRGRTGQLGFLLR